ncbi:MAG: phosphoglycerate kinase [Phycisphaerales bacterium]
MTNINKKTIDQIDVHGKTVLMRVDFNVPLHEDDATITDDRRIQAALPTLKSVLDRGGRLVLMSHLGRPDGTGYEAEFSLKPVATRLAELLGVPVAFPDTDCVSPKTAAAVSAMSDGDVILLENLRFHKAEIENDKGFAKQLAAYGDIYCDDAFGAAHRDHASMVGVPEAMQSKPRVAGLLLERELQYLQGVIADPAHPFVAVLGGAKVSEKLGVIHKLMGKVDSILVGGAMAYTFLAAMGKTIGKSKAQLGMINDARKTLDAAAASATDLLLPSDHVCGKEMTRHSPVEVYDDNIPDGWMGLDIGPKTAGEYAALLGRAKTIIWNGPMGVAEIQPFDLGTRQIADAIAKATKAGATTIVGGGDSAAAVHAFGMDDQFSHVSTGGGASLELLEGKRFRSVELLDDA